MPPNFYNFVEQLYQEKKLHHKCSFFPLIQKTTTKYLYFIFEFSRRKKFFSLSFQIQSFDSFILDPLIQCHGGNVYQDKD